MLIGVKCSKTTLEKCIVVVFNSWSSREIKAEVANFPAQCLSHLFQVTILKLALPYPECISQASLDITEISQATWSKDIKVAPFSK